MTEPTPIPPEDAQAARTALLVCLAEVVEAAHDACASSTVLHRTDQLAALCDDAAQLARTLAVITRRSQES